MTAHFLTTLQGSIGECPICLECFEETEEKTVVGHTEEGEKHPFHFECLEEWADTTKPDDPTCPICRVIVDPFPYELLTNLFV